MGTSDSNGQGVLFPWELVPQAAGQYLVQMSPGVIPEYTPMDLYLMGLLEPAGVPPFVVLDPPDQPLVANTTVTGSMVSVNDVIAAVGPRVPPASWPRNYNMATVVVSRLRPLTDREMAFFDYFTARAEATEPLPYKISHAAGEAKPFALATQGRGSLATSLPCFGVAEKPNLPQYRAVCKHCPPLLIGLDDLIRTTPMRNEGLRRSLRAKLESAGEAYARADADAAANVFEAFLRELAAQSGRGVPAQGAHSLDVLARQVAQSLRIALPVR
jgi:hypothetical protein